MRTLTEQLASLIKENFPTAGFTYNQIETLIKAKLPDYSPNSASPALSHLRMVGVVKSEDTGNGQQVNFFQRDFTEKDLKKIRQHNSSSKKRQSNTPTAGAAMIAIALGENRTEVVDIAQAKRIFHSLKPLFEN